MAQGPMVVNMGNQKDWLDAMSIGANVGAQMANVKAQFEQISMKKDAMMFEMFDKLATQLGVNHTGGYRGAMADLNVGTELGDIAERFLGPGAGARFRANFQAGLEDETTKTLSTLFHESMNFAVLDNPNLGGTQTQVQSGPTQDTGGTMQELNKYPPNLSPQYRTPVNQTGQVQNQPGPYEYTQKSSMGQPEGQVSGDTITTQTPVGPSTTTIGIPLTSNQEVIQKAITSLPKEDFNRPDDPKERLAWEQTAMERALVQQGLSEEAAKQTVQKMT